MPEEAAMQFRLRYVVEDTDRHGNVRLYFRKPGQGKVRLRGPIGSPEFLTDYRRAANPPKDKAESKAGKPGRIVPKSLRWLLVEYLKSAMFKELDPRTQKVRRAILERACEEKGRGEHPYALLLPRHVRKWRDDMMDRPEAANGMVKAVRQLFRYAVTYDLHDTNPADLVEYLDSRNPDGFHSWTLAEIEAFENAHPVGTTARLALALGLYTGQRRADLIQFGRQHVRDGWLIFTQNKNRNRNPVRLEIPIIPELQRIIDATPTGDLTFLISERGRPFTGDGFGNSFRAWSRKAGLADCSVHGLRKAAAARLAELGCTEQEIMSITGHRTSQQVTKYTRAASQKTRAESALRRMSGERGENKSVPLLGSVLEGGTKAATN